MNRNLFIVNLIGTECYVTAYKPRNWTARPEIKMTPPARACEYLSSLPSLTKLKPQLDRAMMVSMVRMVASPKAAVTMITPLIECWAAGYMTSGISGSHGPKTKIKNNTQGVIFSFSLPFSSWI